MNALAPFFVALALCIIGVFLIRWFDATQPRLRKAKVLGFDVRFELIDDGEVMAHVPALPGCCSDGATPDEAMRGLPEAIRSWQAMAKKMGRG